MGTECGGTGGSRRHARQSSMGLPHGCRHQGLYPVPAEGRAAEKESNLYFPKETEHQTSKPPSPLPIIFQRNEPHLLGEPITYHISSTSDHWQSALPHCRLLDPGNYTAILFLLYSQTLQIRTLRHREAKQLAHDHKLINKGPRIWTQAAWPSS